jgi:hypothetical protein
MASSYFGAAAVLPVCWRSYAPPRAARASWDETLWGCLETFPVGADQVRLP